MLNNIYAKIDPGAVTIIAVSLMLFVGFLMTRITKRLKLPNVTAYILTGILIGPFCLDLIPEHVISGTDFLSDIALAFIAFSTGEFFRLSALKKNGAKVIVITLAEALFASVFIFVLTFFVLRLQLAFSIVLSALAAATAPASTMMTIRQTGAKGDFVDTLLQVIALDDVLSLIAFSIAISVAGVFLSGGGVIGLQMEIVIGAVGAGKGGERLGGLLDDPGEIVDIFQIRIVGPALTHAAVNGMLGDDGHGGHHLETKGIHRVLQFGQGIVILAVPVGTKEDGSGTVAAENLKPLHHRAGNAAAIGRNRHKHRVTFGEGAAFHRVQQADDLIIGHQQLGNVFGAAGGAEKKRVICHGADLLLRDNTIVQQMAVRCKREKSGGRFPP